LPYILVDNLNAPFPTMIGIQKETLAHQIDELTFLYLNSKNTAFPMESPVIVDIDEG
jgi:hypothetical protein